MSHTVHSRGPSRAVPFGVPFALDINVLVTNLFP